LEIDQGGTLTRFTRFFHVTVTEIAPYGKGMPIFDTSNVQFESVVEGPDGSRAAGADSDKLLEEVFPHMIRAYSLFKGEAALGKLSGHGTLDELINTLSDGKHYKKLETQALWMLDKANSEVENHSRAITKNKKRYDILTGEIKDFKKRIVDTEQHLKELSSEKEKLDIEIGKAEDYSSNSEALQVINEGIKHEEDRRARLKSQLRDNYVENLFDDYWMLSGFEKTQKEFVDFVTSLEITRRKEEADFHLERGIRIGQGESGAIGMIPLPPNVPTRHYMEEMIREHICKVCNRPAPDGSDPYNYMLMRLKEYNSLPSQVTLPEEATALEGVLKNNYIQELLREADSLDRNIELVEGARRRYKDRVELNNKIFNDLARVEMELDRANAQKFGLFEKVGATEDKLLSMATNYKAWTAQMQSNVKDITLNNSKLEKLREDLGKSEAERKRIDNLDGDRRLIAIERIMEEIVKIVRDTRQYKFEESVASIEKRANEILNSVNVDSFTGHINIDILRLSKGPSISVRLLDIHGDEVKPNESLATTVHLSVLHAITEMAGQVKESSYPVIMDAPISSFDNKKKGLFLNHVASLSSSQRIVMLMDLLDENKETGEVELLPTFYEIRNKKSFLLKLRDSLDTGDSSTISTQVIELES
jgi:DNA sulfur modification protein DndD